MDIISAIDQATGCQQCGKPLDHSVSDDFCGEGCQRAWHAKRTRPFTGPAQRPDLAPPWSSGWALLSTPNLPAEAGDRLTVSFDGAGPLLYIYDGARWRSAS